MAHVAPTQHETLKIKIIESMSYRVGAKRIRQNTGTRFEFSVAWDLIDAVKDALNSVWAEAIGGRRFD